MIDSTIIPVVAAIIMRSGSVFMARRKQGTHLAGYWEFPGGKLEDGEQPRDCLHRELFEEFGVDAQAGEPFGEHTHDYGHKKIKLIAYWATLNDTPAFMDAHDQWGWIPVEDLPRYTIAPADIKFVQMLMERSHGCE